MKLALSLIFAFFLFLQLNFFPSWLQLGWGLILILILVDFSLPELLALSGLAGFFLDVISGMFFGFNLIIWLLLTMIMFWLARKKLSIERNLASSFAFISFGIFSFLFLQILGLSYFSLGEFSFFKGAIFSFEFFVGLVMNILITLILFFVFNFLKVKIKIDAQRI